MYSFNPNNINYKKIILKNIQAKETETNTKDLKSHLCFIETKICELNVDILDEFIKTKKRDYEWDGNPKACMLYTLRLKIKNEIEGSKNKTPGETTTNTPYLNDQLLNVQIIEIENRLENPTNMTLYSPSISHENLKQGIEIDKNKFDELNNIELYTPSTSRGNRKLNEPTTSGVEHKSRKSLKTIFDDIIKWPVMQESKSKRKKNIPLAL